MARSDDAELLMQTNWVRAGTCGTPNAGRAGGTTPVADASIAPALAPAARPARAGNCDLHYTRRRPVATSCKPSKVPTPPTDLAAQSRRCRAQSGRNYWIFGERKQDGVSYAQQVATSKIVWLSASAVAAAVVVVAGEEAATTNATTASASSPRAGHHRLSKHFSLGISTCHKLVLEVCGAIKSVLMPRSLQWPDEAAAGRFKDGFERSFGAPGVIGAMYTIHHAHPHHRAKISVAAYFSRRHTECNQKTSYSTITLQGVVGPDNQ